MSSSELQDALRRGMARGGDLAFELSEVHSIASADDARTVCRSLARFPERRLRLPRLLWPLSAVADRLMRRRSSVARPPFTSALFQLVGLFQSVQTQEADGVFREDGLPELLRIYDTLAVHPQSDEQDDTLFILKVLAMYESYQGTQRIIQAARRPLWPNNRLWEVIVEIVAGDHPDRKYFLQALRGPLPSGAIAKGLLQAANDAANAGELAEHPFDSASGKKRLRKWLTRVEPFNPKLPGRAAAALPFVSRPERDDLLALALDYPDPAVQLEAAFATARLESEAGIRLLARFCEDPRYSSQAQQYLTQLGRGDAIPEVALQEDFLAMTKCAERCWTEPDEFQVVDHRILEWPLDGEPMPVWLVEYRSRDTTDFQSDKIGGMVIGGRLQGGAYGHTCDRRHLNSPENAYAMCVTYELACAELLSVAWPESPGEYEELLEQWPGGQLQAATVECVYDISPKLHYPQRLVAIASARRGDSEGWAVLDGPRSTWYSVSDFPEGTSSRDTLTLYLGRQLLGFADGEDRRAGCGSEPRPRDPQEICAVYEKLMREARTGNWSRRLALLARSSPLPLHFKTYVAARAAIRGLSTAETTIEVYQDLRKIGEANRWLRWLADGPIFGYYEYLESLQELGRTEELRLAIAKSRTLRTEDVVPSEIGRIAYDAGLYDLAEQVLGQLRPSPCRTAGEAVREMTLLARSFCKQGKQDDAQKLLLHCLQDVLDRSRSIQGSRWKSLENTFQKYRSLYLELFPDVGEQVLSAQRIPSTTFPH